MTHNTPAPVADKTLAERLAYWRGLELECEALRAGRGFRLEEALGQAHRSGQLITLADHERAVQAAVAKAVEAERDACAEILDNEAADYEADAKRYRGGSDPHHYRRNKAYAARKYAAAIRSRGVAG